MPTTRRKPTEHEVRMRRFKAALALRGLKMGQWAYENGVGYAHASNVASGRVQSAVLMEKIIRFTDEVLAAHAMPDRVA